MPLRWVCDAVLKAWLICAILVAVLTLNVMSVNEPSGTGTRIPQPPILVDSSGNILVSAFAAPVVVGTIDCPAALDLLKSRCGWSCKLWSVVYECNVVM